jgi:hypothetical protein
LNNIIIELMLKAERQYCKTKEIALWSPTLYQSNLLVQYYNILDKQNKQKEQKIHLQHRLDYIKNIVTPTTIQEMKENEKNKLEQAQKKHKERVQEYATLQEAYLEQLMWDINKRDPRTKQTIKSLLYREQSKLNHAIVRKLHKGPRGKGINYI